MIQFSIRHPLYTRVYEDSPVLGQWVEHVFNYATSDGFIGLPGQAVTTLSQRFPQFFAPERPPIGSFLIDLQHELQVIFDEALRDIDEG